MSSYNIRDAFPTVSYRGYLVYTTLLATILWLALTFTVQGSPQGNATFPTYFLFTIFTVYCPLLVFSSLIGFTGAWMFEKSLNRVALRNTIRFQRVLNDPNYAPKKVRLGKQLWSSSLDQFMSGKQSLRIFTDESGNKIKAFAAPGFENEKDWLLYEIPARRKVGTTLRVAIPESARENLQRQTI